MATQHLAYLGGCGSSQMRTVSVISDEITAVDIFFILAGDALSPYDESLLRRLLGAPADFIDNADANDAIIMPRAGTVSPWASKAADILRQCGLITIVRVERGILLRGGKSQAAAVADKMTQTVLYPPHLKNWRRLFDVLPPPPLAFIDSIADSNKELSLALSSDEIAHLQCLYNRLQRKPTDAEMLMFAQANSEHCRHKIFKAAWTDGGESLMDSIRRAHVANPNGTVTAFNDNAAVVQTNVGYEFFPDAAGVYGYGDERLLVVAKAETHNHPTAISPYPGAATGCGGEIRDEAAAGRGAATRAGFAGFAVSYLGEAITPTKHAPSSHLASPLAIMIDAPLGAADYGNEFGRATLAGFFRSFEQHYDGRDFGFHKPLMLAGGLGHMQDGGEGKKHLPSRTKIIQLGGPGFRIGMGGGAASSRAIGKDDFASVQRGNAQMQRRAQEVIDTCRYLPDGGGILSLHDVGAGGLANAVIEMVNDSGAGARIDLSAIPIEDSSLSPSEIWCNESQERYVLALAEDSLPIFRLICARECCPFAIIGEVSDTPRIVLQDDARIIVDLPLSEVLGDISSTTRHACAPAPFNPLLTPSTVALADACRAILGHPSVACKRFLITIGDRTVGGLTARDQMAGPWQTPVADYAAFFNDYDSSNATVFALGERPSIAARDTAAGARLAIAEALSNLAASGAQPLSQIKFSLNWLGNCSDTIRDAELRTAVRAAADFCAELKTAVVVGKDSLFMRAQSDLKNDIESPAMPVATAFAPCEDISLGLTPQLSGRLDTFLLLVEPSAKRRLGGSILAEIFGGEAAVPDIDAAKTQAFYQAISECCRRRLLLAYHDRADGGLWAAACEMAFAANTGITMIVDPLFPMTQTDGDDTNISALANGDDSRLQAALFNEEIGALLEVSEDNIAAVLQCFDDVGLGARIQTFGRVSKTRQIQIYCAGKKLLDESIDDCRRQWDKVSYEIARRRDDVTCAEEEHYHNFANDSGLFARVDFDYRAPAVIGARPQAAILREQGSNGQREMAAAFTRAGFDAVDVTMSDLRDGRRQLKNFHALAMVGGFSYGDVLGAGRGWAESVLQNSALTDMFSDFFNSPQTFAFGACNGCQALAFLQPLMPDAGAWKFPVFVANRSRRFEARLSMVEIMPSPSIMFIDMAGAMLPIVSSHAEGRVSSDVAAFLTMRFINNAGQATESYPQNPNGSDGGGCGFCSPDGRITITMPHPERVFRRGQMSWYPPQWSGDDSPWLRLFINAYRFVK